MDLDAEFIEDRCEFESDDTGATDGHTLRQLLQLEQFVAGDDAGQVDPGDIGQRRSGAGRDHDVFGLDLPVADDHGMLVFKSTRADDGLDLMAIHQVLNPADELFGDLVLALFHLAIIE